MLEMQVRSLYLQQDVLEMGMATPLQYSCLGNLTDRGAWWATVPGLAKTQTWLRHVWTQHTLLVTHTLVCLKPLWILSPVFMKTMMASFLNTLLPVIKPCPLFVQLWPPPTLLNSYFSDTNPTEDHAWPQSRLFIHSSSPYWWTGRYW